MMLTTFLVILSAVASISWILYLFWYLYDRPKMLLAPKADIILKSIQEQMSVKSKILGDLVIKTGELESKVNQLQIGAVIRGKPNG